MLQLLKKVCESYLPSNWTQMIWKDVTYVDVACNTYEYTTVCHEIARALFSCAGNIEKVVRVQNPYLWGCYLLKKEEYACRCIAFQEQRVYYNTSPSVANSIAINNFNWRRSGKRAKYGQGVSFSCSAENAYHRSSNGRVLIVARVLVGRTEFGTCFQEIPNEGFDTTVIGDFNLDVYVKYSDHEFYPEYLVYYKC